MSESEIEQLRRFSDQRAEALERMTKERDDLKAKLESAKSQMVELKRAFLSAENDVCAYRNKLTQVEADAAAMRNGLVFISEYWNGGNDSAVDAAQACADHANETLAATGSGQRLLDEIEGLTRSVHASSKDIVRLENELATLRATAQRRLELLRKCEWSMPCAFDFRNQCPICQGYIAEHKPNCPLAQELKEALSSEKVSPVCRSRPGGGTVTSVPTFDGFEMKLHPVGL